MSIHKNMNTYIYPKMTKLRIYDNTVNKDIFQL